MGPVAGQGAGLRLSHDLLAAAGPVGQGWVFDQLQVLLLDEIGAAGRIDLECVSVDSLSLRAVKGGPDWRQPGRSGQGRLEGTCGPATVVVYRCRWW
jgi:hypothetical protein